MVLAGSTLASGPKGSETLVNSCRQHRKFAANAEGTPWVPGSSPGCSASYQKPPHSRYRGCGFLYLQSSIVAIARMALGRTSATPVPAKSHHPRRAEAACAVRPQTVLRTDRLLGS